MSAFTREDWAREFLAVMDYPVKERNIVALIAWEAAEGGPSGARWNPLNSTQKMPGSTAFNWNGGIPVQNYLSKSDGLQAAKKTLLSKGHGYSKIRQGFKENAPPRATLQAVESSSWGTGGLAKSIVDDVKHSFTQYADQPIGQ